MSERGLEYIQSKTRRRLDVAGALAIGSALAPVGAATAAGVCIDTRSLNPFFKQRRTGKQGQKFDALKFRSLRGPAEAETLEIYGTFDPRASKFGLFIRKFGLDEMPQLVNVLKGEMSLVGMRPSTDAALEDYHSSDSVLFDEWFSVCFMNSRPGLVSTSSLYRHGIVDVTPEVRRQSMRLDLADVENASLRNDLRILANTPLGLMHANAAAGSNASQQAA